MWKIWYKTIPTEKAIKDAIGSKLRSCHTTVKKLKEKTANVTLSMLAEENNGNRKKKNVEEDDDPSEEGEDQNTTSQFEEDDDVTVDSYPDTCQAEGPTPGTLSEVSQ